MKNFIFLYVYIKAHHQAVLALVVVLLGLVVGQVPAVLVQVHDLALVLPVQVALQGHQLLEQKQKQSN